MKIVEKITTDDEYGFERDWRIEVFVASEVTDERKSVEFSEGEPEDMNLGRDLSDAYTLVNLIKLAYECGKRGEEFNLEEVKEKL